MVTNHPAEVKTFPDLLSLGDVPRLLPGRPSLPSVWRWVTRGINGTRLEAVRIGRRWYTTRDAVMRFGEALAAASVATLEARAATTPEPTTPKPRTAARRERDVEAAKAHLRASGLL